MVFLTWGWVYQRIAHRFRPNVWKKRYLVLTTMSIHIYKSEKGVISSLSPDNLPTVHAWSNFRTVKNSYENRSWSKSLLSSSTQQHIFLIEPKNPKLLYPLKFKCSTLEEKEKWLDAIGEQLSLTSKIWSHRMSTTGGPSTITTAAALRHGKESCHNCSQQQIRYALERPIISASVLNKWLDQIQIIEDLQNIRPIEKKQQMQQQERNDVDYCFSLLSASPSISKKRKSDSSNKPYSRPSSKMLL